MRKFEYIFRPINGRFFLINYVNSFAIEDVLFFLHLEIDDDCQFCRIIRNDTHYEYRRYNNSKIILTVYEQNP